nr:unnamed protein product [Callosobruchus analis]
MFIWDWFTGVLGYLGLARKKGRYVFLGLSNTGKSTLIKELLQQEEIDCIPYSPSVTAHSEDLNGNI